MGKLFSYIVSLALILVISYYYLSSFFYPMVMWLGPVLGSVIELISGNLFFLLGDMFHHLFLIPIYVIVGVAIGLCSRKGRKAFVATIGVYGTLLSITSISAIFIYETNGSLIQNLTKAAGSGSVSRSSLIGVIPPIPTGITIGSLASEPLVQRILSLIGQFSSSSSSLSASSPIGAISNLFPLLVHSFIIFAVEDLIVVMATAIIICFLIGKYTGRNAKPKNSPNSSKSGSRANISTQSTLVVMIIILLLTMSFAAIPINDSHSTADIHQESLSNAQSVFISALEQSKAMIPKSNNGSMSLIAGFAGKTGDRFTVLGSLQNNSSQSELIPGTQNAVFSLVEVSLNFSNLMNQLSSSALYPEFNLSYNLLKNDYNILSGGILISLVREKSAVANPANNQANTRFISSFGGSNTIPIFDSTVSGSLIGSNASTSFGLYMYAFSMNFTHLLGTISNNSIMTGNEQEHNVLNTNLQAHFSASQPKNISSFIFVAGYLNGSSLTSLLGGTPLGSPQLSSGSSLTFSLSIFEENSVYHSSGSVHNFTLSQLIDYSSNLSSLEGSNSVIVAGIPETHVDGDYLTHIYYGTNSTLSYLNFASKTHNIRYGSSMDPQSMTYTSNTTFPANLSWVEKTGVIGTYSHYIYVNVTNTDNSTLCNVTLNASEMFVLYPSSSMNLSGLTSVNSTSLSSGSSLHLNFTVNTKNPGFYVFPPPELSYLNNKTSIVSVGYTMNILQGNVSLYSTANGVIHFYIGYTSKTVSSYISILNITIFSQFYLFDLLISLLIVIDIALEIRMFIRWKGKK